MPLKFTETYAKGGDGHALFESALESYGTEVLDQNGVAQDEPKEEFGRVLQRSMDRGRFKADDIDWDLLFEHMPESTFRYFEDGVQNDHALFEEAASALTASEWDALFDRCVQYSFREFSCGVAPFTLADAFSRIDAPCSDFRGEDRICEWVPELPPDMCCWPQEDGLDPPAKFNKVGQYRCWRMPNACTRDFSFALHRSLVCVDPQGEARRQIERHATLWRDLLFEKERVDQMFGLADCDDGDCSKAVNHGYWYDDVKYASAYLNPEAGGPWVNSITDPNLQITRCCLQALGCRIKEVYERMRDPWNCFPLDCPGAFQITITNECQADAWAEMNSVRTLERTLCGEACETKAQMTPRFLETTGGVKQSRWIWDRLVDWYLNCYSELYTKADGSQVTVGPASRIVDNDVARQTAEFWAANTYLLSKSYPDSLALMMDFEETRNYSGEDKWQYFDRGITWARRYIFKYSHMWLKPWLTLRIRGFDPTLDVTGSPIPAP